MFVNHVIDSFVNFNNENKSKNKSLMLLNCKIKWPCEFVNRKKITCQYEMIYLCHVLLSVFCLLSVGLKLSFSSALLDLITYNKRYLSILVSLMILCFSLGLFDIQINNYDLSFCRMLRSGYEMKKLCGGLLNLEKTTKAKKNWRFSYLQKE